MFFRKSGAPGVLSGTARTGVERDSEIGDKNFFKTNLTRGNTIVPLSAEKKNKSLPQY